jgi:hypothetical protein
MVDATTVADPNPCDPTPGLLNDRNRPSKTMASDPEVGFADQLASNHDVDVNPRPDDLGWPSSRYVHATRDGNPWAQDDLTW